MKNIKIINTDKENYIDKLKLSPDCIEHYNLELYYSSEVNLRYYYYNRWVISKICGISLIKNR
jgi:hypothetical protein